MKDTFDFNRFGRLLVYECCAYVPRFAKALVVFVGIMFAMWLLSALYDSVFFDSFSRSSIMGSLFYVALFITPFVAYTNWNNRKKGSAYAMLPASTLEKLLSMLVICMFVLPLATYVVLVLADSCLYLISSLGLGKFYGISVFNPFSVYVDYFGAWRTFVAIIGSVSYSMMFNAVFRSAKIIKTILFNIALWFVVTIMFTLLALNIGDAAIIDILHLVEELGLGNLFIFWLVAWPLLCLFITYKRIERVNY